jgi:hypothetical protein
MCACTECELASGLRMEDWYFRLKRVLIENKGLPPRCLRPPVGVGTPDPSCSSGNARDKVHEIPTAAKNIEIHNQATVAKRDSRGHCKEGEAETPYSESSTIGHRSMTTVRPWSPNPDFVFWQVLHLLNKSFNAPLRNCYISCPVILPRKKRHLKYIYWASHSSFDLRLPHCHEIPGDRRLTVVNVV